MAYLRDDFVRVALAQYLDLKVADIETEALLGRDLGLEPLDLVLIVFRLEEFADAEFSISDLEGVVTVGDFEKVVRAWARDTSIDEDDDPPATADASRSGTHVLGKVKLRAAR